MDEQFDEKLKNRITEVFEDYPFPPADEAWLELRKKFPVKEERKVAWLWWSSAAAILMIFLGLGLWFNNKQDAGNTVAIKPAVKIRGMEKPQATQPTDIARDSGAVAYTPPTDNKHFAGAKKKAVKRVNASNEAVADNIAANTLKLPKNVTSPVSKQGNSLATAPQPKNKVADGTEQDNNGNRLTNGDAGADKPNPVVTAPTQQQVAIANVPTVNTDGGDSNPATSTKPGSVVTKQPAKTMEDLLNESKTQQVAQKKTEKKELKKVNFSVYAATYLNYAEGSANQVNAGAGFTSDIRLSKRVKLSTGVSLAQNTLSYAGTVPVSTSNRALASSYNAAPQADGLFNPAASVAELKGSNASLMGLDIPINIKYEFNPDKTDTYISAGLSSGTFIDERYTYRYAYNNNGLANSAVSTQEQTTTQSFNGFYFGKTLNVSFGTGFPIGKTNRLVIEPFLKYPLGGLGAQSIHFGAGGINLKFNFKATK